MLILMLHERERTTRAIQDLPRRTAICITLIRSTISLMEVFHLWKHLHIVPRASTQILDNTRLPRTPSNGTLPHSRHTSTDMDQNAFVHIAISYPAITSTCKTCESAMVFEIGIGTHTVCPPRPSCLIIPPVALPTGFLLPHPIVPTPPVCAAAHRAKDTTP
jgi:hypothetical protein